MAGESPDKAEQQGSSQETKASGGGRDPRLSVLRESDASSSASVSSSSSSEASSPASSVQVDQPTAVFKTLAPRTPEDDAPSAAAEPEADAESEQGSETAPEPESDRLKAAVAAWVATAEEPEAEDESESEEGEELDEPDEGDSEPDESVEDEPADEPEDDEPEDEADDEADEEPVEDSVTDSAEAPADSSASSASSADSWFAARKSAEAEQPAAETPADSDEDDAADEVDAADGVDAADDVEDEPVDQPTTMFKAVRLPAAPAVDQPTTALKLPPSLTADSDSERTSTFLPLRADIPAEQKAQKAQEAPRAPRTPEAPKPAAAAPTPAPIPVATPKPTPAAGPAAGIVEAERTRQQPLPPLPPLDLLAELTNTPPPPPTPLRTTMRRLRIWTPLVLLLLIVFAIVQMVRPLPAPALTLSAAPTFTFEGGELKLPWPTEGQGAVEVEGVGSMGTYGAQKPAPIASVTKTMTAYVILRDHPLKGSQKGPEIEIDAKAAEQGKAEHESTAAVQQGQTYTERELLELLMIPSANNVARLLARWDAGSEAAFVEKMNAAAKDLGMSQSTYTDPSGLLDSTVSTPQDQLKLAKAVMQYDVFREIVNMPNLTVDGIPGRIENNNNILLKPGVSGIKTGSSTPAGGNLLWSANTVVDGKNRRILGIVMGAKDAVQLGEKLQLAIDNSYKIIQQAQKDVTSAAVVRKGQVLGYIDDGLGGRTPVVATKELKAIGWPGLRVKLQLTNGGKAVPHTGKAGDVVGQVSIGTGAGKVSSPVALQADLVEPGFDKKLTRVG
ncbi:D-alanyl-D-alanine carboxypeptidase family protein [Streptomyces sp. NBC_00572]|uniref:D-alanyl-D-alanine carboxypeptidase family protein n=1 Tax=Streptomyces sp. NBC_00572 TaxID=2903664 RepID=UPI0022582364|nr:serine hydrolase [Streptomyces sp. NBC_00572]MCX4981500.1 D-alanyl-D-alanine carboxypeptidase [Streptomyces sp. NBC_00572]